MHYYCVWRGGCLHYILLGLNLSLEFVVLSEGERACIESQVMSNALEHYHNFLLVIERWTLVVAGNEKAYIRLFNAFQQGHNDLATVFTIAAAGGLFQDDVCFSFFFWKGGFYVGSRMVSS